MILRKVIIDLLAQLMKDVIESKIDINILVGCSEEMGKSNISSSVMQIFLQDILDCALSPVPELVLLSFEIVSVILKQGLVHPILVIFLSTILIDSASLRLSLCKHIHLPTLDCARCGCTLNFMTSTLVLSIPRMWNALKWHTHFKRLIPPGPTSFHVRFQLVSYSQAYITTSFLYDDGSLGQKKEAILNNLYLLSSQKKARRNEFLLSMVKFFDLDLKSLTEPLVRAFSTHRKLDVFFMRFVAENLARLEFKNHDELLFLLFQANRMISVTGESVVQLVEDFESQGSLLDSLF